MRLLVEARKIAASIHTSVVLCIQLYVYSPIQLCITVTHSWLKDRLYARNKAAMANVLEIFVAGRHFMVVTSMIYLLCISHLPQPPTSFTSKDFQQIGPKNICHNLGMYYVMLVLLLPCYNLGLVHYNAVKID